MIQKLTLQLLFILFLVLPANAARYITDDLYAYLHSGPSIKYKIIARVDAGEHIKVLKTNKSTGFTQIRNSKGQDGWIKSKYLSRQLGLKERFLKLQIGSTKLEGQLATAEDNLKSHSLQISDLKNTNDTLNRELQELKILNNNLNEKLDTSKYDVLLRWFSYGGIVAGIGLLLGLILPSLIRGPRKRNHW